MKKVVFLSVILITVFGFVGCTDNDEAIQEQQLEQQSQQNQEYVDPEKVKPPKNG